MFGKANWIKSIHINVTSPGKVDRSHLRELTVNVIFPARTSLVDPKISDEFLLVLARERSLEGLNSISSPKEIQSTCCYQFAHRKMFNLL